MDIDESAIGALKTINAHFICNLDPEILVPLNTAVRLGSQLNAVVVDQGKAVSYAQALQNARNAVVPNPKSDAVESRWSRQLALRDGKTKKHSYALYAAPQGAELWFQPLSQIRFGHPLHLANVFAIVRQYAVVWNLLRKLVLDPTPPSDSTTAATSQDKRRISKRSNASTTKRNQLNGIKAHVGPDVQDAVNVDISLDVLSDPTACTIEIFLPLQGVRSVRDGRSFIHSAVIVKLNGVIEVSELSGISNSDTSILRTKLSRILTLTEDIGMAVEWLTEQATNRP